MPSEIDAARKKEQTQIVTAQVQSFPPGYIEGGKLSLNDNHQVMIDPLAANIAGRNVETKEIHYIDDPDWTISRVATPKIISTLYQIYLTDDGKFHVSAMEPVYDTQYFGYYHPVVKNARNIGKFWYGADGYPVYVYTGLELDVHKVTVRDSLDRSIEISADKGIYAVDASTNVIHDIPNAPIVASMTYGGHLLWLEAPNAIGSRTITYTDATTTRDATTTIANIDVSAYLGNNTNVRGALVNCQLNFSIDGAKATTPSIFSGGAYYCRLYNDTTGSTYQRMIYHSEGSRISGQSYYSTHAQQALIPIVYNASVPYVSWYIYMNYVNMTTASQPYSLYGSLYIMGITI